MMLTRLLQANMEERVKPNSSSANGVYHVKQYRVRDVLVDFRLLPGKIDNVLSDNIYGMTKSVA